MSLFSDRLIKSRERVGITQKKLAELLEITPTRLNYWEKGKREPDVLMIKKISSTLNVNPNYLIGLSEDYELENTIHDVSLKQYEIEHIEKYRKLDDLGREIINLVTDAELKRITPPDTPKSKITDFEEEKKKRELPYYTIKASAGNGNFLATNDYILIEVDEYVPQQANYALKVKGDSMEPKYHDGDIVYVKTQKSIENGEIGIFCVDDDVYIKKLEYVDGKYRLISLNPAYKPIEIKASNEFMCFGKVLN